MNRNITIVELCYYSYIIYDTLYPWWCLLYTKMRQEHWIQVQLYDMASPGVRVMEGDGRVMDEG